MRLEPKFYGYRHTLLLTRSKLIAGIVQTDANLFMASDVDVRSCIIAISTQSQTFPQPHLPLFTR
jgi:hypothetical protein